MVVELPIILMVVYYWMAAKKCLTSDSGLPENKKESWNCAILHTQNSCDVRVSSDAPTENDYLFETLPYANGIRK